MHRSRELKFLCYEEYLTSFADIQDPYLGDGVLDVQHCHLSFISTWDSIHCIKQDLIRRELLELRIINLYLSIIFRN